MLFAYPLLNLQVFMKDPNLIPNLLLAGAPKCGTTSVYDWLVQHPDISGGVDKELFYLLDPSDWKCNSKNNWGVHKELGYSKYFKKKNKYLVDGTTLTMYQQCALDFAKIYKPKVLIFLREPSERIYSTFKYFRDTRTVLPKNISFKEYIGKVKSLDDFGGNNQLSGVFEQSRYSIYIKEWTNCVSIDNLKVIDFERLKVDKLGVMSEICEWLGVESDFYKDFNFTHKNETSAVRFRSVNKVKEFIGKKVKNERVKSIIRPAYDLLNKKKNLVVKSAEDKECLRTIYNEFSNEVDDAIRISKGLL